MCPNFTIEQISAAIGASRNTVRRWCRDGRLKAYRFPGKRTRWRIDATAAGALLSAVGINGGDGVAGDRPC